ncbi:MAG: hypothetical protein GY805_28700 [Chloroflexi bacterium]|nr:hypothetical protein [Chloroflexota bacterium]
MPKLSFENGLRRTKRPLLNKNDLIQSSYSGGSSTQESTEITETLEMVEQYRAKQRSSTQESTEITETYHQ